MGAYYDAEHLGKFVRAMEANGITDVRAGDNPRFGPLVARNGETTILQMPLRWDAEPRAGRHADNDRIVVSGESGRVIAAPERTDTSTLGREYLEAVKSDRAARLRELAELAKGTPTYGQIVKARRGGETDAAKVYGEGWEKAGTETREAFEKALRAKTDAEALDILTDHLDAHSAKFAETRRNEDKTIARAERRIAAEDALEALVMRRADAEAYLGREAAAAKDARFSRRPEEDGGTEADAETMRVNPRLAEEVRTAIAGDADGKPVGRRREVAFSEMPDALKAVGIPDLPIRTRTDIVHKIHRDHGFTEQQIVALPEAYGRPAAVFSDSKAYVVLTGMQVATRGGSEKPVMVVLRESVGRDGRREFLASAHPREEANENFYEGLARNGKMLFLDKNKVAVSGLNGRTISTLNEQADGNRVKAATLNSTGEVQSSFESAKDGNDTGSMPHSAGGVKGAARPWEVVQSTGAVRKGKKPGWRADAKRRKDRDRKRRERLRRKGKKNRPPGGGGAAVRGMMEAAKPIRQGHGRNAVRQHAAQHVPGTHPAFVQRQTLAADWNGLVRAGRRAAIRRFAARHGLRPETWRRACHRGAAGAAVPDRRDRRRRRYAEYDPFKAQAAANENSADKGARMPVTNRTALLFRRHVAEERLSPCDAICRMRKEMPGRAIPCLSTWHRHVNAGDVGVRHGETPCHPKRRPKGPRPHPARTVPGRLTLDDRPAGATNRSRFGHYEMDTVVSGTNGRGGLLVLVDRKSRRYAVELLEHVAQDDVVAALRRMTARKALGKVLSITTDNGCEFLDPGKIKAVVSCDVYYTRAYASWEKGSVENCNRFVRRWYPKGTDFSKCTRADMRRLEHVINSIHRRLLGGKTAYEYDTAYAKAA